VNRTITNSNATDFVLLSEPIIHNETACFERAIKAIGELLGRNPEATRLSFPNPAYGRIRVVFVARNRPRDSPLAWA